MMYRLRVVVMMTTTVYRVRECVDVVYIARAHSEAITHTMAAAAASRETHRRRGRGSRAAAPQEQEQ